MAKLFRSGRLGQWSACVEVDFDNTVCSERGREDTLSVKNDVKESAMNACAIEF